MLKVSPDAFFILFIQSFTAGLLAVLTPFVYAILPITTAYLTPWGKPQKEGFRNVLLYALSLLIIFTLLGTLLSTIVATTGLSKVTTHWLFNFFVFRIFAGLGLSFLGAFQLKLPDSWANPTASKSQSGSFLGIFNMALTLPLVSFSSTGPLIVLVLILAVKTGVLGPLIGFFAFGLGLGLPFIFPKILGVFVKSKDLLNQVKVLLGFSALLFSLKFFSYADISLGWNVLGRDMFIVIWMILSLLVGSYMLGIIKLPLDPSSQINVYGQEYISIVRLFIAIGAFTVTIYLLPGLWGAPLHGVSGFLPPG